LIWLGSKPVNQNHLHNGFTDATKRSNNVYVCLQRCKLVLTLADQVPPKDENKMQMIYPAQPVKVFQWTRDVPSCSRKSTVELAVLPSVYMKQRTHVNPLG